MTSVIFAMAVPQILLGLSRLAQSPATIRPYLAHSVWALDLFVLIFANWWANWEFRAVDWSLPMYAYMLVPPTLLFFACSLLFPQDSEMGEVDLTAHFFRIRRPFLLSFFFVSLAVVLDGSLMAQEALWHPGRIGHAFILAAPLWGLSTENKRSHNAAAIVVLLALGWSVAARADLANLQAP